MFLVLFLISAIIASLGLSFFYDSRYRKYVNWKIEEKRKDYNNRLEDYESPYYKYRNKDDYGEGWRIVSIALGVISILIISISLAKSYNSYVDCRAFYDGVNEQYFGAVEMYQDKAILSIEQAALTDFKYQGYQSNISRFVRDLRDRVADYNSVVLEKRVMSKTLMFNWLIVAPDKDMKVIVLNDKGKK